MVDNLELARILVSIKNCGGNVMFEPFQHLWKHTALKDCLAKLEELGLIMYTPGTGDIILLDQGYTVIGIIVAFKEFK